MERLSGALLVLAGVTLGAYSLFPASEDAGGNFADVTSIAKAPDRALRLVASPTVVPAAKADTKQPSSSNRVFSSTAPLVTAIPGATGASTATWTAVVTTERAASSNLKSPKAGDSEARAHLASDLQRELKRVGCYGGDINGAWTQSTRRAMALFMERVNATLPANEPDYILLTLVQNHTALACGTDCPAGEVYGNDGRCLPAAVVAQTNRRAQRLDERLAERRDIEQRKAAQQENLAAEQRAAEARRITFAQRAEAERLTANRANERRRTAQRMETERLVAQRLAAASVDTTASAKPAQIASVKSERLPWLENRPARLDETPASTATAATPQRAAPPPGMMSIGGPRGTATTTIPSGANVGQPTAIAAMAKRNAIDRDSIDSDDLSAQRGYTITAPAPHLAIRPVPPIRQAALAAGLPGTKSGEGVRAEDFADPAMLPKYKPAKIVRRPPPYYGGPRVKRKYYAYNGGGKTRRGQPPQGTARYNLLHTLGGIY